MDGWSGARPRYWLVTSPNTWTRPAVTRLRRLSGDTLSLATSKPTPGTKRPGAERIHSAWSYSSYPLRTPKTLSLSITSIVPLSKPSSVSGDQMGSSQGGFLSKLMYTES